MSANDKQVAGNHYAKPLQHWDYVVANNMPYLEAMAFKYIDRHALKGGKQDLEKAMHFIEKMIETYYPVVHPMASDEPLVLTKCPNDSEGKHDWSHMYKYGANGRMADTLVCNLCKAEAPA
jgi:hypothetical protein